MSDLKPHEDLMSSGLLTDYQECIGNAMFVSHQWLAFNHPDPNSEQLKVLQAALGNIRSRKSQIHIPVLTELYFGRLPTPTAEDFAGPSVFIWYDYFSCPQGMDGDAKISRQQAIDSIVSYISRCKYFVVLCPALMHVDQQRVLGQHSWAERGWCRTERLARELAARRDGAAIVIESGVHQYLMIDARKYLDAPGAGHFTLESDRPRVARALLQMVWKKLLCLLEQGDWHNYRFLLNTQSTCCFKGLDVMPLEGLIPGFSLHRDPFSDPAACVVEWFLHENGFRKVSERDRAGWTPLCYAAISGNAYLVESLLKCRASCNERITKKKTELAIKKNMPVLSLATHFHCNEIVKILLSAKVNVNATDHHNSIALHWACHSNNVESVRILCAAGSDRRIKMMPGIDCFTTAVGSGAEDVVEELLTHLPKFNLQYRLHHALIFYSVSTSIITTLLRADADVNERLRIETPTWRLMYGALSIQHRVSPSMLTSLAYHHHLSTPLMLSVLNGCFGASRLLLQARADVTLRNSRGKTAADLAKQVQAPESIIALIEHWHCPAVSSEHTLQDEDFVSI
ncbi:ANKRA2 [Symbiodinium sp. CCMP2592]|nr:ANKRA2 [Symbiodinium sp. CCMP2592]